MKKRGIGAVVLLMASLGTVVLAQAEVVQKGDIRVNFEGKLSPTKLPRTGEAPVRVSVSAKVAGVGGEAPPAMQAMTIEINRHGHLNRKGLPVCRLDQIQPATTEDALAACRSSIVGEGQFRAAVLLNGRSPFPSHGKVYAFNGELEGKPAILAHVYGARPAPASYTIPFVISGHGGGTYGMTLKAKFPPVKEGSGYITGISLNLGATFTSHGKQQALFTASCPAPKGFNGASFPFAKASVGFAGGKTVGAVLNRSCTVRG